MDLQKVLTEKIATSFDEDVFQEESVKLKVVEGLHGLYDVYYYTFWAHDELKVMEVLQEAEIAPLLSSVRFLAEDEGVNGTQAWDLGDLLSKKQVFENMKYLEFPLNNNKNHNRIIVTNKDDYGERGGLGQTLDRMPQLEVLIAPSAPSENFFQREVHPLRDLTIQTGFAHQDFIQHLANSSCFERLEKLDFTDYSEEYMDNYIQYCVSFEHFEALMHTKGLPLLKEILLRNTQLTDSQQQALLQSPLAKQAKLSFTTWANEE
ncbi:hypothetical protein BKI52_34310 [marine bacterium AO1-C]|nr:hypothetical protein BKI52_34310 [marine bacterium AO1-C]